MLSFSERMEQPHAIAQERRNRGLPTGKDAAGWQFSRPADDPQTWHGLCRIAAVKWQSDCRDIRNTFQQACLNRPGESLEF